MREIKEYVEKLERAKSYHMTLKEYCRVTGESIKEYKDAIALVMNSNRENKEDIKALYDSAEERQKGCSFTLDLRNSYKPECSDEDFILFLPYTYFKEFVTLFSTPGNKKFRQKQLLSLRLSDFVA